MFSNVCLLNAVLLAAMSQLVLGDKVKHLLQRGEEEEEEEVIFKLDEFTGLVYSAVPEGLENVM